MLPYAAFVLAMVLVATLVRGNPDRRPGPIRFVLFFTLFCGLPLGFGEYRASVREGRANAWIAIPIYVSAFFVCGCVLWFIKRRRPSRQLRSLED